MLLIYYFLITQCRQLYKKLMPIAIEILIVHQYWPHYHRDGFGQHGLYRLVTGMCRRHLYLGCVSVCVCVCALDICVHRCMLRPSLLPVCVHMCIYVCQNTSSITLCCNPSFPTNSYSEELLRNRLPNTYKG